MRIQGGKVLVLKNGPQGIAEREIGMAFRKSRMGNAGRFFRHRRDDVRVERHAQYPSAAWVKASESSGAILCHSPLPRGTLQMRKRVAYIFTTENIFCSKLSVNASHQTSAPGTRVQRIPPSKLSTIANTF